jgi:membrane associated rhomboid family serine protease
MIPLHDTARQRRAPVMTGLLVMANLAVFGWEVWLSLTGGGRVLESFLSQYALVPGRLVAHYADEQQWLTLLTHMFLHGGLAHVLGNLWFLWIFGGNVEDRLGSFTFLLFYVAAGLAAAALQIVVEPGSMLPMVGASGAISGVLGAYLVLFPTAWVVALVPWVVPIVPVPAVVFLVLWFVLQAYNGVGALLSGTSAAGGVAWWAHAGGFVAGICLVLWAKDAGWVRRR